MHKLGTTWFSGGVVLTAILAGCASEAPTVPVDSDAQLPIERGLALDVLQPGQTLPFTPLTASSSCTAGGKVEQALLPPGFLSTIVASEGPGYLDNADMNTVNETGRLAGRYLYRTHETGTGSGVSMTDLVTGVSTIVAQRADWERFDGLAWTPWGTLLAAEEASVGALKDPGQPNAIAGHVYEIDPASGAATVLPALGSKPHEGIRFDKQGNVYGISETGPGYLYKFVPDHHNDLSSGQLYALKIVTDLGDRTGWAEWVALDRAAVQINAVTEAAAKGATGYSRPEDVEIGTSTGDDGRGNAIMYVAVTGEDRVLAIDLKPQGAGASGKVFVSDYIREGVNAPADFDFPDNLALDRAGDLFISEDPGGTAAGGKTLGDDVWFAPFNPGSATRSLPIARFLSITDCDAEPTGVYVSPSGKTLFLNIQHRGGADQRDVTLNIQRFADFNFSSPAKP